MSTLTMTKLKASQFLRLGEDPEGVRLELINGEIIVSPRPTPDHSITDRRLTAILMDYIRQNDLGELVGDIDVVFDALNVRCPDMAFIAKARLKIIGAQAIEGAPDLCIEILSPSTATLDRVEKFQLYESHGVGHYWIIDPHARSIDAFALVNGRYQLAAEGRDDATVRLPPFAELAIRLGSLWR